MDFILSALHDGAHLLNSMSPYILFGFLLSGLLHEFMPRRFYSHYLAGTGFRSVVLSALFGVPMPLCSCGVIPAAIGLRREGVSRGATASFLIATPQTGVDSVIATYCLMGLPFALVRPIAALFTAIFGGALINYAAPEAVVKKATAQAESETCHCHGHSHGLFHRLGAALRYSFVDMMEDIGKWLLVGLAVAGIITSIVPDEWFTIFHDNSLLSMCTILLFCIPMYLCATGSIPIAVALMLKGLSPGTALVMLMAGPSCNMGSILVIRKVLGQRTMVYYLLSIIVCAILFGLGIDHLLPREWFTSNLIHRDICCETSFSWIYHTCTVIMGILLVYSLIVRRFLHKDKHCCCHDHHCH